MNNQKNQLTLNSLLSQLQSKGHQVDSSLLATLDASERPPIMIQILAGIGGFFAALFIALLVASAFITIKPSAVLLIAIGIVLMTAAFIVYKNIAGSASVFFEQFSQGLMVAGKLFFVIGFSWHALAEWNTVWGTTISLLLATVISYPFYRVTAERFLAVVSTLLSIPITVMLALGSLYTTNSLALTLNPELLINTAVFFELVIMLFYLFSKAISANWRTLLYSAACALFVTLLLLTTNLFQQRLWIPPLSIELQFIKVSLSLALITVIFWVAKSTSIQSNQTLNIEALVIAIIGAVLLGYFSTPGIIFSLLLLILAYHKNALKLAALGSISLAVFLCYFYYSLKLTLLEKSSLLIVSGLILLAGAFYIKFRRWNQTSETEDSHAS